MVSVRMGKWAKRVAVSMSLWVVGEYGVTVVFAEGLAGCLFVCFLLREVSGVCGAVGMWTWRLAFLGVLRVVDDGFLIVVGDCLAVFLGVLRVVGDVFFVGGIVAMIRFVFLFGRVTMGCRDWGLGYKLVTRGVMVD